MPNLTPETGRAAVLTLESLAQRISALADRAFDVENRYTEETDRDLGVQISTLTTIADSCVWSSPGDYEDEKGLERLRLACEQASKAWSFLRSDCPSVQRALKEPSLEDAAFIRERLSTRRRSDSPYCTIEDRGDGYGALRQIQLPASLKLSCTTLDSVLWHCDLAQARRVLRALGIAAEYAESNGERVLAAHGHIITRNK
jgi:hypothetical protein